MGHLQQNPVLVQQLAAGQTGAAALSVLLDDLEPSLGTGPGLYQLTVRATDGSSRPQTTSATGSYPDGATGLQQLQVEVG